MKKNIFFIALSTGLLNFSAHAKTIVCTFNTHTGNTDNTHYSRIIIDTELKYPGTKQAYIDVEYKNGDYIEKDVFYQNNKDGYFRQKITQLDDSKVKVVTNSYFNKEIFELDLKKNSLSILIKENLSINSIAVSPKFLFSSKTTYDCLELKISSP